MKLILKLLAADLLTVGKPTDKDLFNALGQLLLTKGKLVTPSIKELLLNRELYIIEYEWKKELNYTKSFSPDLYQKILRSIERIYFDAHLMSRDSLLKTVDIVGSIINNLEGYGRLYFDFNSFRTYDNYTYVHSINVAIIATLIASQIGYRGKSLRDLCLGALLHDLGKLMIPSFILEKPTGLTPEEFEIMQRHPSQGQHMIQNLDFPSEVLLSIRQHHERWNGNGYPDRLSKRGIHPYAQIVAVADVFDALIADRPYRKGLPPYHALELIMAGSGIDFAPDVVQAFKGSLVLYPENSFVTLNTGETGVVIAVPSNYPTRPLIRILFDEKGCFINDERIIDLLQDLTRFIYEVEFDEESMISARLCKEQERSRLREYLS